MTNDELKESIIADLTVELEDDPQFDADILTKKVENAIKEVKLARGYARAGYTDEMIESDIQTFHAIIRDVALYDYNQSGLDFQTSSQENGNQRTFMIRRYLFNGVIPLAKMV